MSVWAGLVHAVDEVRDRVAVLVAEVDRREAMQRHVDGLPAVRRDSTNCCIGARSRLERKRAFRAHPVRALLGDRALGQLVRKPDLELGAVKAALAFCLRDEKLAALLAKLVGHLGRDEGRRREDELQAVDLLQLAFSASNA